MSDLIYVFGITKGESSKGFSYNGLSAITAAVDEAEFGESVLPERLKDVAWLSDKVVWHQDCLSEWSARQDVIPFKFGSIFKSVDNVIKMLADQETQFKSIFQKITGRDEWGLKLFYQPDQLTLWLEQNDSELSGALHEISESSSGKAFLLKKKYGQQVKETVKQKVNETRSQLYELVNGFSEAVQLANEQPAELTSDRGINAFNAALLIDKSRGMAVQQQVVAFHEKIKASGMALEYTGPWPAYNFATL